MSASKVRKIKAPVPYYDDRFSTLGKNFVLVVGLTTFVFHYIYPQAYVFFAGNEFVLGTWATWLLTAVSFALYNVFFLYLDLAKPKWAQRYKVQQDEHIDLSDVLGALPRILFNFTAVGGPMTVLGYYLGNMAGCSFDPKLMPNVGRVVYEIFIFLCVEETHFYYGHRLLHHPRLYKHIHKIHHEWTSPIGITAVYAHPLEHFLSNTLPPLVGPLLCGSHYATIWTWYAMVLLSTTISHSGYRLPYMPSPDRHDFHHLKFNNNFGSTGTLDWLHGTDDQFRKTTEAQHTVMGMHAPPHKKAT